MYKLMTRHVESSQGYSTVLYLVIHSTDCNRQANKFNLLLVTNVTTNASKQRDDNPDKWLACHDLVTVVTVNWSTRSLANNNMDTAEQTTTAASAQTSAANASKISIKYICGGEQIQPIKPLIML